MKKSGFPFLILLLASLCVFPAFGQSGKVTRKRNVFGVYKYHQEGQKFPEKEFMAQMPVNSQAFVLMQKARKNYLWSNILGFSGGFVLATQLSPAPFTETDPKLFVAGLALFGAGLHFSIRHIGQSGLALDLYNESLAQTKAANKTELKLGFTGSGLGMQFKF